MLYTRSSPIGSPLAATTAARAVDNNVLDLTPRSKIRAMLASLDEDSDKENAPNATQNVRKLTAANLRYSRPVEAFHDASNPQPTRDRSDSSSDEDTINSKSHRLVEGMQHMRGTLSDDDFVSEGEPSAYERVRKQLLGTVRQPTTDQSARKATGRHSEDASPEQNDSEHSVSHASPTPSPSPPTRQTGHFSRPISKLFADSESDTPSVPSGSNRLEALIAAKRAEREAREQGARNRQSESESDLETSSKRIQSISASKTMQPIVEFEDDEDNEAGEKFTQQARPTRKASKKALEEMSRETQRMNRNMQLTHEARTKSKFTTDALFAKFNFRQTPKSTFHLEAVTENASSSQATSLDAEANEKLAETPPSSPPSLFGESFQKAAGPDAASTKMKDPAGMQSDDEHSLESFLAQARATAPRSEGQNMADEQEIALRDSDAAPVEPPRKLNVRRFAKSAVRLSSTNAVDSDDDLEIVAEDTHKTLAIWNSIIPAKPTHSKPMHNLRKLANVGETAKREQRGTPAMNNVELRMMLQRKAREQALREREERLQKAREKGIAVQTTEEKEREQMQLENMLEKAREEAKEIRKREKEAAKKEGAAGEHVDSSDSDDGEWEGDQEEDEDAVQLSGSEEEEEDEGQREEENEDGEDDLDNETDEESENQPESSRSNALFDNEAEDASDEQSDDDEEANAHSDQEPLNLNLHRGHKRRHVIDDDDDEEAEASLEEIHIPVKAFATPKALATTAFPFGITQSKSLGLSQVFAGTMAATQTQDDEMFLAQESQEDSMALLRALPPPDIPLPATDTIDTQQTSIIQESQIARASLGGRDQESAVDLTQTPAQEQRPDLLELTQDVGFQSIISPDTIRIASYQTVSTMPLSVSAEQPTPLVSKKGRLIRGVERIVVDEEESDGDVVQSGRLPNAMDAFEKMRAAASKQALVETFDKKKSEAKEMVEEQAEESEDEYAGLGGASDDESQGDVDEETKKLIDDESNEKVDERELAAYHADKERIDDEKRVEKLYRDIANGGLRRKRGAEMDLFDSDDEDGAAERRRKAKQREFAKMRKALMEDRELGEMAENPKRQAFFHAVEDREGEDDLGLLDHPDDTVCQVADSQPIATASVLPLQSVSANAPKRKLSEYEMDALASQVENRPPPHLRRSNGAEKPRSLADIRNTLSDLIGEPDSLADSQHYSSASPSPEHSDDEANDSDLDFIVPDRHNDGAMNPPPIPGKGGSRRTPANATRTAVVDRMALKRQSSSLSNRSHGNGDRLAFQTLTKSASSSFRVPSLLRRVTTGSSVSSNDSASTSAGSSGSGFGGKEVVKMGGSKKSSINYHVREHERRAKIEAIEKERMEDRQRVGRMRRTGLQLGALVGGRFE